MKQATLKLLPAFIMSAEDIASLTQLPDNLPDKRLTAKQKDLVDGLYSKYIRANNVSFGWGNDLYELEQKEKWPSVGKVKQHQAKRMILGWLATYNQYYNEMTGVKALEFLHNEMTCREAARILILKAYTIA